MSTKIGHFEILSELSQSPSSTVYKANDPESGQTVALKAIQLSAFGESSQALEKALLEEAEKTKVLSSPNISPVFGAGEIEGQFCATMEYVQGNSIATMLARKEGFSIWDLLDIGRQLCAGLDHAASKNLVHYSLEPSKIMCGWDGTVKILSFGVSSVGNFAHHVNEGLPSVLYYMSPEQVQGQPMDSRSNLFSLGAMFYEMVTERKAFDRDDIDSLRQSIVESTPTPPVAVNPKIHPLLSNLIMKALAKDPAERYQTGRELLDDLEKCKESKSLAAKKAEPAKAPASPQKANPAAQSKFVTPNAGQGSAPVERPKPAASAMPTPAAGSAKATPSATSVRSTPTAPSPVAPVSAKGGLAAPKAAAAAAGIGGSPVREASISREPQELDPSDQFVAPSAAPELRGRSNAPSAQMSSAIADAPEIETEEPTGPTIAVDPLMAGGAATQGGTSFSEISELPPLKEVYIAPPPPPSTSSYQPTKQAAPSVTMFDGNLQEKSEEKPKVQPHEVAQKAIKEIKSVPPKLLMYSLSTAGVLILLGAIGFTLYVHNLNSDDDSGSSKPVQTAPQTAPQVSATQVTPQQPVQDPAPAATEPVAQPETETPEPRAVAKTRNSRKKATPVAPAVVPGQLTIDSTPQGAQVQLDGRSDPSWVTPFALNSIPPGQHTITVSKPGYSTDTRAVNVAGGNRTTTVVHLSQLMATLVVKSDPAGASIYVDGRDVGTKTPAQVSVDKGQHVVLVRMMGYIDETMNAQFALGQTFNFSPTLRPLGNADNIRSVGKMSKLFGGKGVQAGQATLSIRTQPKGAQIAINQHLLEKNSPAEVALDPGNYVIDITLTGYAPIHKIITVDKGGKAVIDEVMHQQ